MSLHDAYARTTPLEIAFPDAAVIEDLVRAVHATATPIVAVLLNGRPYAAPWLATSVPALVGAALTSFASHTWTERSDPEQLFRAWALAVAWPLGQYIGARRAGAPFPVSTDSDAEP